MTKKILLLILLIINLFNGSGLAINASQINPNHWSKIQNKYYNAVLIKCDQIDTIGSGSLYCIKTANMDSHRCEIRKIGISIFNQINIDNLITDDSFNRCIVEKVAAETFAIIKDILVCHINIDNLINNPYSICIIE